MSTDPKLARDWLKAVAALSAGPMPLAEIKASIDAMTPLLSREFDPWAFTPGSLAHVARASTYFPRYAQVCALLVEWGKDNRPMLPRLAGPPRAWEPKPAPTEAEQIENDRAWWSERIDDCAAIPNHTARWRHATGMHATLTRPGAEVREWAIGRLVEIITAARTAGADTNPKGVRWPHGTAVTLRHVAYAQGRPSGPAPPPEPEPPRTAHLTPEQIQAIGHRERRI